ncbi:MAG TPA: carbon monoxide dehydrogenase subunit G [Ramlibacter sp.]|nr:carbon monoxide dehydrogenase subunit G [Ramlibacter sp.]
MEMQGNRTLPVTQQQAWEALNDPEVLKLCIPGCDRMEPAGENQYAVGVAVKIGPVSAKFNGKVQLSDINPPNSYKIAFEGQGGAAGFGKGQSEVRLTPSADGASCELNYTVQAQVGGKIAQMGQRLIDGVAKSMAEDFFKRFDAEMQRRYPAAPEAAVAQAAAPAPAASSAQDGAARTQVPVWVWVAGAVVLIAAGVALLG